MRILLANDDGVEAPGIEALVKALYKEHEVIVSAPAQQQSGMSHAMTLGRRLYIECYQPFMDKYGVRAWRVYGTPADSVKAYLEGFNEAKPDVVISGINDCHNLGTDNIYSGTVGAAVEGFFHNIPSMAISFNKRGDISLDAVAAEVAARLEKLIGQSDVPQALNINFPNELKEKSFVWKWAAIGRRIYTNAYNLVRDDDGRTYYLVEGIPVDDESNQDSDIMLSKRGFVTVTPLMLDSDDKSFLASHHGMELSL